MTNSNRKGKRGERELSRELRKLGVAARRGQQFKGSPDSPDVVTGLKGFHVECKRVEALSLYPALSQAAKDAGLTERPIVAHRRNNKPWVVILRLDDFVGLCRAAGQIEQSTGCDTGTSCVGCSHCMEVSGE